VKPVLRRHTQQYDGTIDDATMEGMTMQLMLRRDVATDVRWYDGKQCDGRYDDAFDKEADDQ
jgi:hypothetical protein